MSWNFNLYVVALGAVAGFTIFLGLPFARLNPREGTRAFLNALSVGILLFLFVEISFKLMEGIEEAMKLAVIHLGSESDVIIRVAVFVVGFASALLAMVGFESRFFHAENGRRAEMTPRRAALVIAAGIGLHNFGEGLVIGQEFASGAMSLGILLVVGFALHNATEGLGIAGPLSGIKPTWKFLGLLGLIGGGPTFIGTIVGVSFVSPTLEAFFLALAAGAILYIVGELIHLGKRKGQHLPATLGLLCGFFVAFASDLYIERAVMKDWDKIDLSSAVEIKMEGYQFTPSHLTIPAGKTTPLYVQNLADMTHEIEILGLGGEIERVLEPGQKTVFFLHPRKPGRIAMVCDMPGHLANGMYGVIQVK